MKLSTFIIVSSVICSASASANVGSVRRVKTGASNAAARNLAKEADRVEGILTLSPFEQSSKGDKSSGQDNETEGGIAGADSVPTLAPSASPAPSGGPSDAPSLVPSASPAPSGGPSEVPSLLPSDVPSEMPSDSTSDGGRKRNLQEELALFGEDPAEFIAPTLAPSASPAPSGGPSEVPSSFPSEVPSSFPSGAPSDGTGRRLRADVEGALILPAEGSAPSLAPSASPGPSDVPSLAPSASPAPSGGPSDLPSGAPSVLPSGAPSDGGDVRKLETNMLLH